MRSGVCETCKNKVSSMHDSTNKRQAVQNGLKLPYLFIINIIEISQLNLVNNLVI